MPDPSTDEAIADRTGTPHANGNGDDFGALRHILVGEVEARQRAVETRLNDPGVRADELSRVLPEAIARSTRRGTDLTAAIQPNVEKALEASVRKNSKVLADVMFPVMGPAMRKAVAETLRERLQSLNRALEQTFSMKGLQWRFEAVRSGKSFAEIAMLHTMLYRVEQVFLIHNDTGLVLRHLQRPDIEAQDADMVASMLSAIRDFTRDSFRLGDQESLNTLEMGDLTLWMEQGPRAMIVAVIRGNAPMDIRHTFQAALEHIESEQADLLAQFNGDTEPFAASDRHLESCLLQAEAKAESSKMPLYSLAVIAIVLVAIAAFVAVRMERNRTWRLALEKMDEVPGVTITDIEKRGGTYHVSGLRDPLSMDPASVLSEFGLSAKKVEMKWEPYQALAPSLQLDRATRALLPPESVRLEMDGNTLKASGHATRQWILDARQIVRGLAAIESYDDSKLQDEDADLGVFLDALAQVQGIIVTNSVKIGERYVVSGFRDPLTKDPNAILASLNLDPQKFDQRWEAYQALGEGFILERAQQMLEPPDSVTMTLDGKILVAKGEAPHVWIVNAYRKAPSILGLEKIDFTGLIDSELKSIRESVTKIEEFRVYFNVATIDLADGQDGIIEKIAEELNRLHELATQAAMDYTVQLMGHADSTGTAVRNMELSQRRAQQTRALLAGAGIKDPRVHVLGVGVEAPLRTEVDPSDKAFNRAVSFYVDLVELE